MNAAFRLVALSPGDLSEAVLDRFLAAARSALGAGLEALLWREPGLEDRPWLSTLERLVALRDELAPGARVFGHDRVHLARLAGADGVHLGFRSLEPRTVRELWPEALIGLSCHVGDPAPDPAHVDHAFFGPVCPTPSKEGLLEPTGFDGLERFRASCPCPVYGIGGLGPDQAEQVLAAGAAGMAVLSGILSTADPGAAVRAHRDALLATHPAG